jgi:hypothetical protein
MIDYRTDTPASLPVANYSSAIAKAVDWLGDRYLLAQPINAGRKQQTPAPPTTRTFNAQ